MALTYNDPNRTKERQNSERLTDDEMNVLIAHLNNIMPSYGYVITERLQRLIDYHQNLQHFYDVAGGWDGLLKLQALKPVEQTGDIEVNYEIVKTK